MAEDNQMHSARDAQSPGNVKEQLRGATQQASQEASRAAGEAMQQARDAGEEVKRQAREAGESFREQAEEFAKAEKVQIAEGLGGMAKAIESAAGELEEKSPAMGRVLRTAAESVKSVSGALRERDVNQLTQDLDSFARRRPGAMFAAAVMAGFAVSRFVKSSAPHGGPRQWEGR